MSTSWFQLLIDEHIHLKIAPEAARNAMLAEQLREVFSPEYFGSCIRPQLEAMLEAGEQSREIEWPYSTQLLQDSNAVASDRKAEFQEPARADFQVSQDQASVDSAMLALNSDFSEDHNLPVEDEDIRLSVSENRLVAILTLLNLSRNERPFTKEDILAWLSSKNIREGIKMNQIDLILSKEMRRKPIVIADVRVMNPKNDYVIYYFDKRAEKYILEKDESIQRMTLAIPNIQTKPGRDFEVMIVGSPVHNRPLRTVFGEPTCVENEITLIPYKRTAIDVKDILALTFPASTQRLFDLHPDMVYLKHSVHQRYMTLVVMCPLEENLVFPGHVQILSDVQPGISIQAEGNVLIKGNAECVNIKSLYGTVTVEGVLIGNNLNWVEAAGSIYVKSVYKSGILMTRQSVYVREELLFATVIAGQDIVLEEENGRIVGGFLQFGNQLKAAIVGDEEHHLTPLFLRKYSEANQSMKHATLKGYESIYRRTLVDLVQKLGADALSESQIQTLIRKFNEVSLKFQSYCSELERIEHDIQEEKERLKRDAVAVVSERLYPGVTISVRNIAFEAPKVLAGMRIYFLNNQFKFQSMNRNVT